MTGDAPRLVAVMVTFRRPAIASETLKAVRAQDRPPDQVWLIDNDPEVGLAAVASEMDGVTYVPMSSNAGPAGGFAHGMELVLSSCSDDDYLLLIDDDDPPPSATSIGELLELISSLDRSERVGCVGLVGARFDRRKALMRRVPDEELDGVVDVDCIAGNQCPIVSVRALREVGPYDRSLFFGFEELDFMLRLRSAHWRVVVDGATVLEMRRRNNRLGMGIRTRGTQRPSWRRYYSSRNIVVVARRHGTFAAPLLALAHSGFLAAGRSLIAHRSPSNAWMALRGAFAGLRGESGRTVEPL